MGLGVCLNSRTRTSLARFPTRRKRKEGYESDDSDGKPAKKKGGDEDDMFGDEEEVVDKKKKDKKEVKFLNKKDIEGQEWDGGVEYEEDGTKIEPFNMDEELEEGWVVL